MNARAQMSPSTAPVVREIQVGAPPAQVFRVFTEQFDAWWPRSHHIAASAMKRAVLECRVGGRWYEIGEDGSECNWGKVLVWEPPKRLVLAWQISGEWKYDPALITEVEVNFISQGPNATQVVLEHRNLDRFGAAADAVRSAIDGNMGWPGILEALAKVAAA